MAGTSGKCETRGLRGRRRGQLCRRLPHGAQRRPRHPREHAEGPVARPRRRLRAFPCQEPLSSFTRNRSVPQTSGQKLSAGSAERVEKHTKKQTLAGYWRAGQREPGRGPSRPPREAERARPARDHGPGPLSRQAPAGRSPRKPGRAGRWRPPTRAQHCGRRLRPLRTSAS